MNSDLFRQIPQVNDLLALPNLAALADQWTRGELVVALRRQLDQVRAGLRDGHGLPDFASGDFANDVQAALVAGRQPEIDLSPFSIGRYK